MVKKKFPSVFKNQIILKKRPKPTKENPKVF